MDRCRAARALRRRIAAAGPRRGELRAMLMLELLVIAAAVTLALLAGRHDVAGAIGLGVPLIAGGFTPATPGLLDAAVSTRLATADPAVGRIDVAVSTRSTNADMQTVLARLPSVGFSAVQYGTISLAAGVANGTATITSVDTTKSCVIPLGIRTATGTFTADAYESLYGDITLTNATTVTFTRRNVTSIDVVWGFAVVYFATAKSVQTAIITCNAVISNTATLTAVDPTKTLVFPLGMTTATNLPFYRDTCTFTLTNGTTVTMTRGDLNGILSHRFVAVEML